MASIADFTIQAVKGIKQSFDNTSKLSIEQFKDSRMFNMVNTTEFQEIFTSTEGLSGAKKLAESETPPSVTLRDGYSVTLTEERFGSSLTVTSTQMHRMGDNTTKIGSFMERQRDQLLQDNQRLFITRIHLMLNEAFDSTSEFVAPDGVELAGTHVWKSGTTFANKDTQALDAAAIDTLTEYAGAFVDSEGNPYPLNFDHIVVKKGTAAERQAIRLFAEGINPVAVGDINIYEGMFTIIATPYITAANKLHWHAFDSSIESPLYVGIGKTPTLGEPMPQNNGSVQTNVEGFWKQGINNIPYSWYASTGTA